MTSVEGYALIAPRKSLTRKQKADIFVREKGICHICGEKIDHVKEPWDADHVIARAISGRDDLEAYKPAHERCHDEVKTPQDRKDIAKCDRLRANNLGVPKSKGRPVPGSKNSRLGSRYNKHTRRFEAYLR